MKSEADSIAGTSQLVQSLSGEWASGDAGTAVAEVEWLHAGPAPSAAGTDPRDGTDVMWTSRVLVPPVHGYDGSETKFAADPLCRVQGSNGDGRFRMSMRRTRARPALRRFPHVGVLIETSLAAGRDMLAGIAEYVRRHEQWIVYMYAHDIHQPPPLWFRQWRCDGIIVRLHDARVAEAVLDRNRPVVDVLGVYDRGLYPLVHTDNVAIGEMAADHFHQRGFVNYGFFGLKDEYWSLERRDAFVARVAENGHTCSCLTWTNHYERRSPIPARLTLITDWLKQLRLPTAIFVSNDSRAMILRDAAISAGYVVGRDLAILGVGNDRAFCEMPAPSLSSVDADHKRVGYEAAAVLDKMMKGEAAPSDPVLVPPREVVVRESTDFLAVPDEGLRLAVNFIRMRAVESIGVDDVADACHMSRSVLQRRFKEHLGQTVHDVILQEKTRHAIRLIRETTDSIENIARAAGFHYVQSMNKALRRMYGRSAGDYRQS